MIKAGVLIKCHIFSDALKRRSINGKFVLDTTGKFNIIFISPFFLIKVNCKEHSFTIY